MQEAVSLCRPMFPSLISSLFFHTIIFDQNGNKIIHPPCFHCDNSLILRQFSARFNGIVDSIAEKGADVQRLYEIYIAKINKSREIDLLSRDFSALSLIMISRKSFPV